MSTLNVGTIKSVTANVPPLFQDSGGTTRGQLCRASIRFNQQGTQTINQSYNISSITDEGSGNTTLNFTNVIRNESGTETGNYAAVCGQDGTAVSTHHLMMFIHGTPTSSQLPLIFFNIDNSNVRADSAICCCSIFA
tara:strand:+ start:3198 stop:3608 length:411 start_codon:yes stop_codon:yes gene_type:complete